MKIPKQEYTAEFKEMAGKLNGGDELRIHRGVLHNQKPTALDARLQVSIVVSGGLD